MSRVLLVDDEPDIRLFYSDVLVETGHEVLQASSGDEALACANTQSLDLVILDIKLGTENGLSVLRRLVHDHPCLPVVLLSAYLSFQDDYTSWLAHSYLVKSGDPGEFLQEVQRILQQTKAKPLSTRTTPAHHAARTGLS